MKKPIVWDELKEGDILVRTFDDARRIVHQKHDDCVVLREYRSDDTVIESVILRKCPGEYWFVETDES